MNRRNLAGQGGLPAGVRDSKFIRESLARVRRIDEGRRSENSLEQLGAFQGKPSLSSNLGSEVNIVLGFNSPNIFTNPSKLSPETCIMHGLSTLGVPEINEAAIDYISNQTALRVETSSELEVEGFNETLENEPESVTSSVEETFDFEINLGGTESGLKDELVNLRAVYLQQCLENGNTNWAKSLATKQSLLEILNFLRRNINPNSDLFKGLSRNMQTVISLLNNGKISIDEDIFSEGNIKISAIQKEDLFTFLEIGDFFGRTITTIIMPAKSNDEDMERLVNIDALEKVQSLSWSHSNIAKKGVQTLFGSKIGKSLRRLILNDTQPNDEAMKALTSKGYLIRITHLDLSMNKLEDPLPKEEKVLKKEKVKIPKVNPKDRLHPVYNKIKQQLEVAGKKRNRLYEICPKLEDRSESQGKGYNVLNDEHLAELFGNEEARNLVDLSLRLNMLSEKASASLKKCVFPRLKKFDLGSCNLGNEGVSSLTKSVGLGNLEELILTRNSIGDKGMASIAETKSMPKLKSIDLNGNGIIKLLIFENFPDLELVDLTDNPIGIDLVDFIKENQEKLKAIKYKIRISESRIPYNQGDILEESGLNGTVFEIVKSKCKKEV